MKELLQIAYLLALLLWIPLGILAVAKPSIRGRVMVPLVMSVIGALYEVFMRSVYPTSIRVDIFLVLAVLGVVYGIAGLALFPASRLAGSICLAVPALSIVGVLAMKLHMGELDRNLDMGHRFRFEAAFRNDATEKRLLGDLKPGKNPWAGYYVYAGKDDDRFAHLVVNDAGRFWVHHANLHAWEGSGAPNAAGDAFEGVGDGRSGSRMTFKRGEAGLYSLEVEFSLIKQPVRPAAMRKAAPPRFPLKASGSDEVRFAGVFSAAYGERQGGFWVIQVWLWESKGKWWGQYIRDHYQRGTLREFISTEEIAPVCSEQCKVLSFPTSRGPATLTRISADEIVAVAQGEYKSITLKRGETLPGFILDLAPTATRKENREWIKALTTAGMITWSVPKD